MAAPPPLRLGFAEPALPHVHGGEEAQAFQGSDLGGWRFLSPTNVGESWLGGAETERGSAICDCPKRYGHPKDGGPLGSSRQG